MRHRQGSRSHLNAGAINPEPRIRQSNSHSLSASSPSLSPTNTNINTSFDSNDLSRDINRSVPELRNRTPQNSFREAIVDRLISFRVRMQQSRINSIERTLDNQRRISNAISSEANPNSRDFLTSRRMTLLNRNSPYVISTRYTADRNSLTQNNLRRTSNSDSSSSRLIESIARRNNRAWNSNDNQSLRLCPVINTSTEERSSTNIVNNLEQLVENQSNLRHGNSETFLALSDDSSTTVFNPVSATNRREAVADFLARLELNSNNSNNASYSNSMR